MTPSLRLSEYPQSLHCSILLSTFSEAKTSKRVKEKRNFQVTLLLCSNKNRAEQEQSIQW